MRPEDLLARLEAGYAYDPMYGQLCNERDQLKTENAKLRELVRILKYCADECGDCDACPINDVPGVRRPWLGCHGLHERMRELGIEVVG